MPSHSQEDDMGHDLKNSVQYHSPKLSNEKFSSTEDNRNTSSQGKTGARISVPATPLGNRHKRWPGRRVSEVEEVVKYMSSIPNYLKQLETGEVVQVRALNCGVLDWGHLERWTYLQKQAANRRGGGSPSSSNASSSPFSTFGSSSHSDRSIDSPPTTRSKVLNPKMHQNASEQSFELVANPDLRSSLSKASIGRNCERAKVNILDMKQIFSEESAHARRLSYDSAAYNSRPKKVDDGIVPGVFASKPSSTSQSDEPSVACNSLSKTEGLNANANCKYQKHGLFSEIASEKVNAAPRRDLSPQRLLRAGLNRIKSASFREGSSVHHRSNTSHDGNSTFNSKIRRSSSPQRLLNAGMNLLRNSSLREASLDTSHDDNSTSNSKSRRSSAPQRLLNTGMNLLRNSSLREASSVRQMKETVRSDNSQDDHADSNVRSRRSPLRRIFDPLKPKNQIHFSGPVASLSTHRALGASNTNELLIRDQLKAANAQGKSSDTTTSPFSDEVTDARYSVEREKQTPALRQALLKIVLKDGLPFFVFSSSDINILSSTVREKTISENTSFKSTYTIYATHELKKKGGVWSSQINNGRKHGLVHNVVGQMKVSSSSSEPKSNITVREFVLFSAGERSHTHEFASSQFQTELAAIVIQVQNERPENHSCEVSQSNGCSDSSVSNLQTEENENRTIASILAIIPSGVHGISSTGMPSPLIERWKSGGSCDCGGWDEGCMLTVLAEKIEQSTADGSHRTELLPQGGAKGNKHAFSMVTFQEGIFRVDFGTSISTLQAFAMCIAILDNRKPPTLSGLHCSADSESSDKQILSGDTNIRFVNSEGGAAKSYALEHPPVSPVRRA